MTFKNLKKLIAKAEAAGVTDDTEVYSEQASCNDTDCLVIARDEKTDQVSHIYISDSSPDELEDALKEDKYIVEIIYGG